MISSAVCGLKCLLRSLQRYVLDLPHASFRAMERMATGATAVRSIVTFATTVRRNKPAEL